MQWGQWHHLHRTSLAETDFDHRAHSLDGAQCYSHLAIMSSLLKYVFCKRNEKKFKCFHLSLLFYILRQCLLQPLSQYAAKASFELLLLVPLPPLCLGLQVCATMPGSSNCWLQSLSCVVITRAYSSRVNALYMLINSSYFLLPLVPSNHHSTF